MKKSPDPPEKGRRALVLAAAAGTCALAAGVGGPAVAMVLGPIGAKGKGAVWVPTVRLDQLREGEPARVAVVSERRDAWTIERNVDLGSVWLVRNGDRVLALSAVCPHLGCSIDAAAGGGFLCPCHTSAFSTDGTRKSGPAPRDMDSLDTKVDEGVVVVDFRRFRIGIEEKVEV